MECTSDPLVSVDSPVAFVYVVGDASIARTQAVINSGDWLILTFTRAPMINGESRLRTAIVFANASSS